MLASKHLNILVIDSDHDTLDIIIEEFKQSQLHIAIASHADSISQAINTHHPDLILSEVHVSGLAAYGIHDYLDTLSLGRKIPVIFISFSDHPDDIIAGLNTPALDYIVKPFYPEEVEARIKKYINWFNQPLQ